MLVGTENAPKSHCGKDWATNTNPPYTTASATPVIAEKPYIALNTTDPTKFDLVVPQTAWNTRGQSYHSDETVVGFENVFVANSNNTAAEINAKLATGLHLLLQPGIYNLTESLLVNNTNQVVLGIGMATLNCGGTVSCITVGNVDGVRISGVMFQADWGNP